MYGDIHGRISIFGRLVASAIERTMSMMGNSSRQHAERAMILVSIVD
jgi:hypothetical protein